MPLPSKIDGTSTNGGLGRVKSDNLPPDVVITDAEREHWTSAQELENIKTAIVDLATAAASEPSSDRVAFSDDFDRIDHGWVSTVATGGVLRRSPSLSSIGFPSGGVIVLEVDATVGAKVELVRACTALVFSDTEAFVLEFKVTVLGSGVVANNGAQWVLGGLGGDGGEHGILILCDNGTATLRTLRASTPTDEAITIPAWAEDLRLRLTVGADGTLLERAIDGGEWATVLDSDEAPAECGYSPFMRMAKEGHAGDRLLAVDSVRGEGPRSGLPGSFFGDLLFDQP